MVTGMVLWLFGCAHVALIDGAIPIAQGTHELSTDFQIAQVPGLVSTPIGLPVPTIGVHLRHGLGPDSDMGWHFYFSEVAVDYRYHLGELGPVHLAVDPSLGFFLLPIPGYGYGTINLGFPVRAEWPLSPTWSLGGSLGVLGRQTVFHARIEEFTSGGSLFDVYGGGGLRAARTGRHVRLGFSASLYGDLVRAVGRYGGVGLDLAFVGRRRPSGISGDGAIHPPRAGSPPAGSSPAGSPPAGSPPAVSPSAGQPR